MTLNIQRWIFFVMGLIGFIGGVLCLGGRDWALGLGAIGFSVYFLKRAEDIRKEIEEYWEESDTLNKDV